jgi:hypothetical protein
MQIICYDFVNSIYCNNRNTLTNNLNEVTCCECLKIVIDSVKNGEIWKHDLTRYIKQLEKIKGMRFEEDLNNIINY